MLVVDGPKALLLRLGRLLQRQECRGLLVVEELLRDKIVHAQVALAQQVVGQVVSPVGALHGDFTNERVSNLHVRKEQQTYQSPTNRTFRHLDDFNLDVSLQEVVARIVVRLVVDVRRAVAIDQWVLREEVSLATSLGLWVIFIEVEWQFSSYSVRTRRARVN